MTIYSYTKVWKIEKKIYAFSNFKLPVPINPNDLLYFGVTATSIFILGKVIPIATAIPPVLRFIFVPYGAMSFFRKKKLDGKNPILYFVGYIRYIFLERGTYIERFHVQTAKKEEVVILNWNCSRVN